MTQGFVWVQSSHGEKVFGAVEVGSEPGGMYVGRALHQNDLVPGKVHVSHRVLYLPWGTYSTLRNKHAACLLDFY